MSTAQHWAKADATPGGDDWQACCRDCDWRGPIRKDVRTARADATRHNRQTRPAA